jgi:hypothetical protein
MQLSSRMRKLPSSPRTTSKPITGAGVPGISTPTISGSRFSEVSITRAGTTPSRTIRCSK